MWIENAVSFISDGKTTGGSYWPKAGVRRTNPILNVLILRLSLNPAIYRPLIHDPKKTRRQRAAKGLP